METKETEQEKKYFISALLVNHPGVLTRIAALFSRRGFNIETFSACATEDPSITRMTMTLIGTRYNMYQMIKQMDKMQEVLKVGCANEMDCVYRELLLAKVLAGPKERSELSEIAGIYKARIVDLTVDSLILELTGTPEKLDAFVGVIKPYTILEMARTGLTALARGTHVLKDRDCYSDHIF
ncbi:MAG: acetolactate synthase small subunit [Clostridia bacterium]|nr:acetolactate synthase small subunit [Clostridia bacterium]